MTFKPVVTAQPVVISGAATTGSSSVTPVVVSYPSPDPIKPSIPTTNGGVTISCTYCRINIDGVSRRTKLAIIMVLSLILATILVLVAIPNPLNLVNHPNNQNENFDCEYSCYEEYSGFKCSCACYNQEDEDDFPECIQDEDLSFSRHL